MRCPKYLLECALVVLVLIGTDAQHQSESDSSEECREVCDANSSCRNGECECNVGFSRTLFDGCERDECSPGCKENQKCFHGVCLCEEGYENNGSGSVAKCTKIVSDLACSELCGLNAECQNGECICAEGFYNVGVLSTICVEVERECPTECGENQICVKAPQCMCEAGYENNGLGGVLKCTKPIGSPLTARPN